MWGPRMKAIDTLWSKCVLLETGPRCILCGGPADQAHHIYRRSRFPEYKYDADFGIATCWKCHPKLDRMPPELVLYAVEGRFPDRVARVRDKIKHKPPRTDAKQQRALLRARMHNARSNWMLECCDVEGI